MTATALPLAAERSRRRSGQARAEAIAAYVLSAPAILCLFAILLLPTLATFVLSFTDWQFGAPTLRWIGLDNYAHLAADRVFWKSLSNTVLYVAVVVPVSVGLGLGVALLIEAGTSGRSFYRAAYFLPVTATLIAMATVWEIMLHPSVGLINLLIEGLGFPKQNWLKNPNLALFTLAGIGIWQALGLNMVLLLAGALLVSCGKPAAPAPAVGLRSDLDPVHGHLLHAQPKLPTVKVWLGREEISDGAADDAATGDNNLLCCLGHPVVAL